MLTQLSIHNIVLIERCEIAFGKGLCVLSGETGAGKSILLDALGLVLGARAESGLIRRGETQGNVSAEFDIAGNDEAQAVLAELGFAIEDTLIIRRMLASDGKTRALVNDQPVTVAGLKRLGETLLEIHGQHDQRTLLDGAVHRQFLDDFAGLARAARSTADAYRVWRDDAQAIATLQAAYDTAVREQDYLQHMRAELKALAPSVGEEETLSEKRARMMQGEKLFEVQQQVTHELNSGKGVIAMLRSAQRTLMRSPLAANSALQPIIDLLDKAALDAEEASYALEKAGQDAVYDPAALEAIEDRLFALKAAGRKYNMPVDALATLTVEVEDKLALIASQEQQMQALKVRERKAKDAFLAAAETLSEGRSKAAGKLEKAVHAELKPLKMGGTQFHVQVKRQEEAGWSEHGIDQVRFECATNVTKEAKDVPYASLNKIASGGELSRFMLALKVTLAAGKQAATLIFDEIDAGTGGAVADAIGARLAALGKSGQVLVVTHLPQVAARGSQHVLVSKAEKAKKITTQARTLEVGERKEELARMLAGATITAEARKAAQKLLEQAA